MQTALDALKRQAALGCLAACLLSPFAAHADDGRASATAASATSNADADPCHIDVQGRPGKQFNPTHISVPSSCKRFTVQLIHTGKKPKEAAGHNWVLVRTADMEGAEHDGMAAGPDNDWVKPNDPRVIARTKMLGGGERDSVTFDVSRLKRGEAYTYYCSFPTHMAMMHGTLSVE